MLVLKDLLDDPVVVQPIPTSDDRLACVSARVCAWVCLNVSPAFPGFFLYSVAHVCTTPLDRARYRRLRTLACEFVAVCADICLHSSPWPLPLHSVSSSPAAREY
jgi:hypothetical protein